MFMEDMMDRPKLTYEARCLVILAGSVLERCIENRAREIAGGRAAAEIAPEDVKAAAGFLREDVSDLPRLIEQAMDNYKHRSTKAA